MKRSSNPTAPGLLLAGLVLLSPQAAPVGEIVVGEVPIAIPAPEGFSPLTPEMLPLYEIQRQFVAPSNEEFSAYVPTEGIDLALAEGVPDLSRRFSVQASRSLIDIPASRSDFSEAKNTLKNENARVMSLIEERAPGILEGLNGNAFSSADLDLAFSAAEFVPLPVHAETDRTIAFSTRVRYEVEIDGVSPPPSPPIGIITTTLVHLKGKVLFLYSYAEDSGLEWSREASARWTDAILAANPPGLLERVGDVFGERSLTRDLLLGAIIVVAVALIARVKSVRRKGPPS